MRHRTTWNHPNMPPLCKHQEPVTDASRPMKSDAVSAMKSMQARQHLRFEFKQADQIDEKARKTRAQTNSFSQA